MADDAVQRRLAWAGAWLFAVGMVTGVWAAIVITEKIAVELPRLALAAHLNALLGGLWMIAVAATWTCCATARRAAGAWPGW